MANYFSYLFTCSLLVVSSMTAVEKLDYKRYVESVEFEERGATILLTDGSTWKMNINPADQGYVFLDVEEAFYPTREVYIDIHEGNPTFALVTYRDETEIKAFCVGLTKETKKSLPTIVSIDNYYENEGWFSDTYRYLIGLSDGSVWDVKSSDRLYKWKVGNRIIVSSTIVDAPMWNLINTDVPCRSRAPSDIFYYDYRSAKWQVKRVQ